MSISPSLSLAGVLLVAVSSVHAQNCGSCAGCPASTRVVLRTEAETEHCHWLEVVSVTPDGPAARAGIEPGDVLVSYAGSTVGCLADLNRARDAATTESVAVSFRRGNRLLSFALPRGKLGIHFQEWQKDLVPDKDARVIKGVPALSWLEGKSNSFMGALEAVLSQQGLRGDYTYLCGISGAAFRTHFFDTWCPSSPDPTCGFDAASEALAAVGLKATWLHVSSDGKNKPKIVAAIKKSIDAGMPVLAIDLRNLPEWGVITGYQKNGQELFCRTYFDNRKGYELAEKFPSAVAILAKLPRTPDAKESLRRSFGTVVQNLTPQKYGAYYSGLAAFDKWVERLRTDDFTQLDNVQLLNVVQANYWIYDRVIADRRTGLAYLDRIAEDMSELEPVLADLTALYLQELDLLEPLRAELPCPGSVTRAEQWSRDMRERQAIALATARDHEERTLPLWQSLVGH
ncbi:MAG: PDZ domain-containing protein [candidate division WOR-3 bacterium]